MRNTAILFGSIGTLVETSELQRQAFNKAFQEHGLDWYWSKEDYRDKLNHSGGKSRIERYASLKGKKINADEIYKAKTKNFIGALQTASLKPRPGVIEVIQFSLEQGFKLGFVTTTSIQNVEAVFQSIKNYLKPSEFDFIGTRDMVANAKPAPDIYLKALESVDSHPEFGVAIEDSEPSLHAAFSAGLRTIAYPGENTQKQDYSKAELITDRLEPSNIGLVLGQVAMTVSKIH